MPTVTIIDNEGRVVDLAVQELAKTIGEGVAKLLASHPDWSMADVTIAAYHLQGYISTEVMRKIMAGIIKKSQEATQPKARLL
jgi:hypothetical protein